MSHQHCKDVAATISHAAATGLYFAACSVVEATRRDCGCITGPCPIERQAPAPFDLLFVVRDGLIYIEPKGRQ